MSTKTCTKCKQELPVIEFYNCKQTRDKLQSWCKACVKAQNRQRQQENRDAVNQYNREWRENHAETVKVRAKERSRKHYLENRQVILERNREYRKAHPEVGKKGLARYCANNREKRRQSTRRYYAEHPEKRVEQAARWRARQQGVEIEKVDYKAVWERDKGICHICGERVPESEKGFDHVIPIIRGGPHTMGNVKVSHRACNTRKSASLMSELNLSTLGNIPVSGYVGVGWSGVSWSSRIKVKGEMIHLGSFDSPEEAARVWDMAAIKYRGEATRTNFPHDPTGPEPKINRRTRNKSWQEKVTEALAIVPVIPPKQLPPSSSVKAILLTKGMVTLIDEQDYERVSQYNWSATKHHDRWYVHRTAHGQAKKKIFLHRFILDAPEGLVVDHINGDSLDNRRSNLRLCSSSENGMNRGKTKLNTSGFKGIYLNKQTGRWVARIGINGRHIHLGTFDSREVAATVYDEAAQFCHREFAKTNLSPDPTLPIISADNPLLENLDAKRLYISNTTGYRGVCQKPGTTDRWVARIRVNGRGVHVGIYDTPEQAARAWDAAARAYRGIDARTNFPDGGDDDELLVGFNPYHNKHGFTGVSKTSKGRWMANISVSDQRMYLGVYDTPEQAARAWDAAAIQYRGKGTRTNFPQDEEE